MRLLFTGKAIRASRRATRYCSPITCRLQSTDAAAAGDSKPPLAQFEPQTRKTFSRKSGTGRDRDAVPSPPIPPSEQESSKPIDLNARQQGGRLSQSLSAILQGHGHTRQRSALEGEEAIKSTGARERDSTPQYETDGTGNLSRSILKLLDRRLYSQPDHPICITRKLIESVFQRPDYQHYVASDPVVSTVNNFDHLGFPATHPGRSPTDTYYVNKDHVLRTHTSAHQMQAFSRIGNPGSAPGYTICADVYRRDSIDRTHYPVFHQMEGARLWQQPRVGLDGSKLSTFQSRKLGLESIKVGIKDVGLTPIRVEDPNPAFHMERNPRQNAHDHEQVRLMATHLKRSLELLIYRIFQAAGHVTPTRQGPGEEEGEKEEEEARDQLKVRWVEAYFPFTTPSWELEVFWQGEWLELLGCGIVQQDLLRRSKPPTHIGWAWGLGVERLAMLLFGIPDIRLFWSEDPRFLSQFREGHITQYQPFSKYPECYKDVAFWIDNEPATPPPSTHTTTNNTTPAASAGGHTPSTPPQPPQPRAQPPPFHENDLMELIRDTAGPLVETVKLVDSFTHPTTGRRSLCYRIVYRSLERTLTNEEVNGLHARLCRRLKEEEEGKGGCGGGSGVGGGLELR